MTSNTIRKLATSTLLFIIIGLGSLPPSALADFDENEPLIYTSGFPTADTLRSGEWYLAPIPWGWLAVGAGESLTIAWDYPATLLGYPSGLLRWRLPFSNDKTGFALDAYGVSWGAGLEQKRSKEYIVDYRGAQYWIHLNWSQKLSETLRLHVYGGATRTSYHRFRPHETIQFPEKTYEKVWQPDAGVGLEFNLSNRLKAHINATYGNTFLYVDQVLYKSVVAATLHMAPFSKQSVGILRALRIELTALHVEIPDAQYKYTLPLPLFPYLYWQWGGDP